MSDKRSLRRRIRNARFPVLKTLDDFQWSSPKKINRPQIQNLFRLAFIATQAQDTPNNNRYEFVIDLGLMV